VIISISICSGGIGVGLRKGKLIRRNMTKRNIEAYLE
jgi:hypothetical protein